MKIDYSAKGSMMSSPLRDEFDFLNRFDHDNIVKVFKFISPEDDVKVVLPRTQMAKFVQTHSLIKFSEEGDHSVMEKRSIMLMELCECDLLEHLTNLQGITDMATVADYFGQICRGVKALHDAGLVNLDLKMENVLIDAEGKLKLCDLGMTHESGMWFSGRIGTPNA